MTKIKAYIDGGDESGKELMAWTVQNEPEQGICISVSNDISVCVTLAELKKAVAAHN